MFTSFFTSKIYFNEIPHSLISFQWTAIFLFPKLQFLIFNYPKEISYLLFQKIQLIFNYPKRATVSLLPLTNHTHSNHLISPEVQKTCLLASLRTNLVHVAEWLVFDYKKDLELYEILKSQNVDESLWFFVWQKLGYFWMPTVCGLGYCMLFNDKKLFINHIFAGWPEINFRCFEKSLGYPYCLNFYLRAQAKFSFKACGILFSNTLYYSLNLDITSFLRTLYITFFCINKNFQALYSCQN